MSKKKDALGDRMKSYYEDRTRYFIPRKTFGLIRIDGKAFHTYTKGLEKPFDTGLISDMNETARFLCENIQGARFGFVQSDEIQIVFTDLFERDAQMWFDGNIQKIASISASIATSKFNQLRTIKDIHKAYRKFSEVVGVDEMGEPDISLPPSALLQVVGKIKSTPLAQFDSRVWTVSTIEEAINSFIWRQQDATRNAVSSIAQFYCSHKELHGKNQKDQIAMIEVKNFDYKHMNLGWKQGRMVIKKDIRTEVSVDVFNKAKPEQQANFSISDGKYYINRPSWIVENACDFVFNKDVLKNTFESGKYVELVRY